MARVCPLCKRLTTDEELFCLQCGQQTVDPLTWKSMRTTVDTPPMTPPRPAKSPDDRQVSPETNEAWVKMGLGGMLAFFTFFIVYLVVYLAHALY
ncbi:MAG TPA: hypothetical protein PK961_08265 [bacterium]|nr:hypothetical protein [bacterium]